MINDQEPVHDNAGSSTKNEANETPSVVTIETADNFDNEVETEEIDDEYSNLPINTVGTELQVLTGGLSASNSFKEVGDAAEAIGHMTLLANILIRGKLCPLKRPEDVINAIITGNQYGFPFMTSITNIYPINGKSTMSTHLIRGMLLKNNIIIRKIYDNEPLYQYVEAIEVLKDGNKILQGKRTSVKNTKGELVEVNIPYAIGTINEKFDVPVIRLSTVVDKVTKYTFKRMVKMIDGSFDTQEVTSSYKWSDAIIADLVSKDNWKKHPARMLDSRAFNIGAKEIADDILMGIYSIGELADEYGISYTIDSNLKETIQH